MDKVRIRNLRGLADTGFVDIKPLTILLGANGSGKSSFLRVFPLLRQSVEAATTSPILWFGRYVDFGTFETAINRQRCEDGIEIGFETSVSRDDFEGRGSYIYANEIAASEVNIREGVARVGLTLHRKPYAESTFVSELTVEMFGHQCFLTLEPDGKVQRFTVNGRDLTSAGTPFSVRVGSSFIPDILPYTFEGDSSLPRKRANTIRRALDSAIDPLVGASKSADARRAHLEKISIAEASEMLADIQSEKMPSATWRERVQDWTVGTQEFASLTALLVANSLPRILRTLSTRLSLMAHNVRYSAPLRANAERYYRFQDLAVNELDPQGENLAMFLRNLTTSERGQFGRWTSEHFGFEIELASIGDHRAIKLKDAESGATFDLLDMGFGYSQVLPIITQLWTLGRGATARRLAARRQTTPLIFAMEQPELHLHPAFQKRLMDSFVAAVSNTGARDHPAGHLRLVLETHSETLVNHLGQRVHDGAIDPEQINVLVFGRDSKDKGMMVTSYFDSDGILRDWPHGFFTDGRV